MEDIIWERLKSLDTKDLKFIHYYKLDIKLDYSEIELLYKNYLSKYYFESYNENVNIFTNNDADKISLKLSLFEPELAMLIEKLFESSIRDLDDDLLLFYIKGEKSALVLFKSYYPLDFFDKIKLPHFCYYITNQDTISSLEKKFQSEETLCMMSCSNN